MSFSNRTYTINAVARTDVARFWGVLVFLLLCRLIAMCVIPLNDSTEARYGEIARLMLETNNWVTPMQALGEPFWAKPPLSIWLSALSMNVAGVHVWAARLPALGLSFGCLGLMWRLVVARYGASWAWLGVVVLAGSPFFFLNAGVVMTDPALLFCTTLSMVSCWLALTECSKIWGYLFFVGLGLGLLAKGPLVGVLVIAPLIVWGVWQRSFKMLWQRLPWGWGSCLMLSLAAPWYVLAEIRTPGFLNYFVIGEHISRFLQPGWQGDKYGFAHAAPYGMIWVYAWLGMLPWSLVCMVEWVLSRKQRKQSTMLCEKPTFFSQDDGWCRYLICFAMMPLLFFTFARNIIYPYVFPSLPALALLFVEAMKHRAFPVVTFRQCSWYAGLTGVIFLLASCLFVWKPAWVAKSQNRVIAAWQQQTSDGSLIYWAWHADYSAQFYSGGRIRATRDVETLKRDLTESHADFVVVKERELEQIPSSIRACWQRVASIPVLNRVMLLFRVLPSEQCAKPLRA